MCRPVAHVFGQAQVGQIFQQAIVRSCGAGTSGLFVMPQHSVTVML